MLGKTLHCDNWDPILTFNSIFKILSVLMEFWGRGEFIRRAICLQFMGQHDPNVENCGCWCSPWQGWSKWNCHWRGTFISLTLISSYRNICMPGYSPPACVGLFQIVRMSDVWERNLKSGSHWMPLIWTWWYGLVVLSDSFSQLWFCSVPTSGKQQCSEVFRTNVKAKAQCIHDSHPQ